MAGGRNIKNEIGNFYGNLVVVARDPEKAVKVTHKDRLACWVCVCVCGKEVIVSGQALRNGNNTSCGCMRAERARRLGQLNVIHGGARFGQVTPEYQMWINASRRAKRDGVLFTITPEDIRIPEFCPLLGVRLERGSGIHRSSSPSLDRRVNSFGYVKGNVWVISFRANTWKSNFNLTELKRMVTILEDQERADEVFIEGRVAGDVGESQRILSHEPHDDPPSVQPWPTSV